MIERSTFHFISSVAESLLVLHLFVGNYGKKRTSWCPQKKLRIAKLFVEIQLIVG
jgi:hypothetical protein